MKARVATVMLGCFLAADVVLVAFALRPPTPSSTPSSSPVTRVSSTSPADTGSSAVPPTTGPGATTTTAGGKVTPRPLAVTIAGLDDSVAWRTTVGTCAKGGAVVELTTDGGATWTKVEAPAAAVVRVQPREGGQAFAITAGEACDLVQFTTNDSGATWSGPTAADGGWARQLDKATEVLTPQVATARPCGDTTVIDLSRTSAEQAEALCANGRVKVTNDGGTTWVDSGEAPGGLALSNRLEAEVLSTYVARVVSSCDGIEIVKVIKGADARRVSCVATAAPASDGQVALSVIASSGWLRVGDKTLTASADLAKWTAA